MAEEQVKDEIQERYDDTSKLRKRAIKLLSENDELLKQTIFDKDTSKVLIKLLDGEDKQTIARQKNATDEKLVGAVGSNINDIADVVIQSLGGQRGMRGNPDASAAPKEPVPVEVKVSEEEMRIGEDPELHYDALLKPNDK
jgi:hypothetical protein